MLIKGVNKRGQVTIFVIIAIVIVLATGVYVATKYSTTKQEIPQQFQQLEEYYKSCINEITSDGISTLENKAGFIEEPELVRGNSQEPLSSKMNYLGETVPYWLYIKDQKIVQQAPTKNSMQEQLSKYISGLEGKLNNQGFVSSAPESIINQEKEKLNEAQEKLEKNKKQFQAI